MVYDRFTSKTTAAQLLDRLAGLFRTAATEVLAARRIFAGAIAGTGHPVHDLNLMEVNAGKLSLIAALLEEYSLKLDRIPLPRFEQIIDCAVKGAPIV